VHYSGWTSKSPTKKVKMRTSSGHTYESTDHGRRYKVSLSIPQAIGVRNVVRMVEGVRMFMGRFQWLDGNAILVPYSMGKAGLLPPIQSPSGINFGGAISKPQNTSNARTNGFLENLQSTMILFNRGSERDRRDQLQYMYASTSVRHQLHHTCTKAS
jgi:hypothetical protein